MSFEKVEITQFPPYVQKEIKQAKLNPNDDKYIDETEIGNVLKHFGKKDVKELYTLWGSMSLDLSTKSKDEVLPPRLTPEMQAKADAEYERKRRVSVVELSNLPENLRNELITYNKNKDGILSNNATPDKSDKELEAIYNEKKIDLTKYETKDVIKAEQEHRYKLSHQDYTPPIELNNTTLTYTDGHKTTIADDVYHKYVHEYRYNPGGWVSVDRLCKNIIRTEYFNDGFTQTTKMDEDYSNSNKDKKMKIEENVTYKGKDGFTKKTILNDDGTSYILYTHGWCSWSEEFGDDDPQGFYKYDDFKQVLIKIDEKGNIVKEIENTAQCAEEYKSFQKKYR